MFCASRFSSKNGLECCSVSSKFPSQLSLPINLVSFIFAAYVQEIGRAGRSDIDAQAILFFNKSDIASAHMTREMKEYCVNTNTCRRSLINQYFGFESEPEKTFLVCCDLCNGELGIEYDFSNLST
jgi:superfamily II DNA helicase RecQ